MRVFVAGASGAIGRPLTAKLVAAGHEVTGMTRSEERAAQVRAAGARAAVVDVFDVDALGAAMLAARPEVVVHELTALPHRLDLRKQDLYDATNRVRTEGTRNLLDAAKATDARRFVSQGIAFAYRNEGSRVKSEDDPLLDVTSGAFASGVRALRDMESMVLGADGLDGLVLRYGLFYGPGSAYGSGGSAVEDVRRRRLPIVGKGSGVFSFVHVDDAADATVAAVERGAPGVYNVTDDEPAAMRDWVPVLAEAAGAKRPLRVPVWLAKRVAGKGAAAFALELRGASNEKAKRELGWRPAHPSWRSGFAQALQPQRETL
jgi:nucleoside-diphosphate-sugar epimerase